MRRPSYGLCLPCRLVRVIDADTVVISLPGSEREWHIRLLHTWAPEKNTKRGLAGKYMAEQLLEEHAADLAVFIPSPTRPTKILQDILTFGRLLGYIFLDDKTTLNEELVKAGLAELEKPKESG